MINKNKSSARIKIKVRIRKKIFGTMERPRLCVYRSLKHMYAQLIDDSTGVTIVSSSSLSKNISSVSRELKSMNEVSKMVGKEIASKAQSKNISTVVFDRSGYLYHGNVKALAEGAREGGLKF